MKMTGDVTGGEASHAQALEEIEHNVQRLNPKLPPEELGKIFTCLALDWYELNMEEEGDRLLQKAERVCPGYFASVIDKQRYQDPYFDELVISLTTYIGSLLVDVVGKIK